MAERDSDLRLRVTPVRRPRQERGGLGQLRRSARRGARLGRIGGRGGGRGYAFRSGVFLQRSTVKVAYARNGSGARWSAHGRYLGRESARSEGERGQGFDTERHDVDLEQTLGTWQRSGDSHVFKVIVSPENGGDMDLCAHARALVDQMQSDLGTRLEWAGVIHTNTAHPHVHLVIRGRDQKGESLVIEPQYIAHGIRMRSRELATRELGLRTERDLLDARERAVERRGPTEIDRALIQRAGNARAVSIPAEPVSRPPQRERRLQEIRRLHFLSELGLAEKVGVRTWRLSADLPSGLRELERMGDISRTLANGRVLVSNPNAQVCFDSLREPGEALTGRIVGSGLDEQRREPQPYLLIEGSDGLVHYVSGPLDGRGLGRPESIGLDSIVTLEARAARTRPRGGRGSETVVVATVDGPSHAIGSSAPPLALDLEVVANVRAGAGSPSQQVERVGFAAEWERRRDARREELLGAGVLRRNSDGVVVVATNWMQKLDAERLGVGGDHRRSWSVEASSPVVGRVIARGAGAFVLRDIGGRERVVRNRDVGLSSSPGIGVEIWIRSRDQAHSHGRENGMAGESRERGRGREADSPMRVERLRAVDLRGSANQWTKADEILREQGAVSQRAGASPVVEPLREREELWRRRGIALDEQFEQRARQWLEENVRTREMESLPEAARRLGRPIRPAPSATGVSVRGTLLGFAQEDGVRQALVDTGRVVRALPVPVGQVEVGREVVARAVTVEAENARGRQLVWRLDDLERIRELTRGRGR